jgi:hypothetical protein
MGAAPHVQCTEITLRILCVEIKKDGFQFHTGVKDPCVYFCEITRIVALLHIVDFRATGKPKALERSFQTVLKEFLELKQSGLEWPGSVVEVLGRRKLRTNDVIATIPVGKHCENILRLTGLEEGKAHGLPSRPREIEAGSPAETPLGEARATTFQEAAGSAIYYSLDRRECQFAVKELARKMSKPFGADWTPLKQFARYLLGPELARVVVVTTAERLKYDKGSGKLATIGHSDSDWAGCRETPQH